MNLFRCFVLVELVMIVQALGTKLCNNYNQSKTNSFGIAVATLLEKLSLRNTPLINFAFVDKVPCQIEYNFVKIMENNRGKFLVRSYNAKNISTQIATLEDQPSFNLVTHCDFLIYYVALTFTTPMLHFCPGKTAEELRRQIEKLSYEYPKGRNIKFLIEHEDKFIDLLSIVHFTADQSKCRKSQLVHTNRFFLNENRWQTNKFITEPQHNFHGCELRVSITSGINFLSGFIEYDNGTIGTSGLQVEIVKATAKTFNLSIYFNALGARNKKNHKYIESVEDDVNLNYLRTDLALALVLPEDYLFYNNYIFLIPPGVIYSDTEKLFMPLELEVWIATFVTILIALLTVQIINRLSQQVQDFVYGQNVNTPSLNIMIAFVGGGQSTLPQKSFARFLLMLFILFSLIIRTCFQSKYFEYLQGDFIKSEITSIEELVQRNYTIYIYSLLSEIALSHQGITNIVKYKSDNLRAIFEMTLDPEFHGAVLTDDLAMNTHQSQYPFKILKSPLNGRFYTFPKNYQNFINKALSEMNGRLHNAGLIDFWYKHFFMRKKKMPSENSGATPLTMQHLMAGFAVSLTFCSSRLQLFRFLI